MCQPSTPTGRTDSTSRRPEAIAEHSIPNLALLSPSANRAVVHALKNWPLYYYDYLRLSSSETQMFRFRDGLKVLFRNNHRGLTDRSTVKTVIMLDYYRVKQRTFRPDAVFIDIGAHIGSFALMMAHRHSRARVIAFEPVPASRRLLAKNVELNGLSNVTIREESVAGTRRQVTLNVYEDLAGVSMFAQGGARVVDRYASPAVTLADVFAQERVEVCDYLKLDCEGAEFEIVLGTSDEVLGRIAFIGLEYHDNLTGRTHRDLQARLEQAGFEVSVHPEGTCLLATNLAVGW